MALAPGGDVVGLLAGGRDGRVAGLVPAAEAGGADPAGDGPAAAGQDRAEEQPGQPGGGAAVEGGCETSEPLARGFVLVRRCDDWLRPG